MMQLVSEQRKRKRKLFWFNTRRGSRAKYYKRLHSDFLALVLATNYRSRVCCAFTDYFRTVELDYPLFPFRLNCR